MAIIMGLSQKGNVATSKPVCLQEFVMMVLGSWRAGLRHESTLADCGNRVKEGENSRNAVDIWDKPAPSMTRSCHIWYGHLYHKQP